MALPWLEAPLGLNTALALTESSLAFGNSSAFWRRFALKQTLCVEANALR
jgi:hypothetical protein